VLPQLLVVGVVVQLVVGLWLQPALALVVLVLLAVLGVLGVLGMLMLFFLIF
jgi:hypothetical protein